MKYIVDVSDEAVGFMDGEMSFFVEPKIKDERRRHYVLRIDEEDVSIYTEPDHKAIENEVWEFATICTKMDGADSVNVFGGFSPDSFTKFSYQEAKAKYEAWLKQKDEIFNTGDEVWDDELKSRGVVLRIYNSGNIDILWDDGSAGECIYHKKIHKTGRHFDEVAELLEKMRGEEE